MAKRLQYAVVGCGGRGLGYVRLLANNADGAFTDVDLLCLSPPNELGVDRENTRGNLHFLSVFRARKVPLLVGSRRTSCASGGGWPPLQRTWPAPG